MISAKSIGLLTVLFSFCTSNVLAPRAIAQALPEGTAFESIGRSLRRILGDDEQLDPPTTSRDGTCLITPANLPKGETIWHHQPVFAWQGSVGKIEVINADTQTSLWQFSPESGETTAIYSGEPLQSGVRYQWEVYGLVDLESPLRFQPFAIASRPNRWLVANGLEAAATQTDGSDRDIVIAHISYFTNRLLYTDAIQVLFSANPESPEILAGQEEVIEAFCQL